MGINVHQQQLHRTNSRHFLSVECDDSQCDLPDFDTDVRAADVESVKDQGASVFRNSMLTDVDGNMVKLGDKMGAGKSVVIFLRHLG